MERLLEGNQHFSFLRYILWSGILLFQGLPYMLRIRLNIFVYIKGIHLFLNNYIVMVLMCSYNALLLLVGVYQRFENSKIYYIEI